MDFTINNYRYKKIKDKFFISTDHGSNIILDKTEFQKLKNLDLDKKIKDKLEKIGVIITKENVDDILKEGKKRQDEITLTPSLHIIVPTLRCNMNCIYCHSSSKSLESSKEKFDMDKDTAKKTIDFIFQSPSPNISIEFQGGEPMLNYEIIKYIVGYVNEKKKYSKKYVRMTVVTNLTLMDDKKMKYLLDNDVSICTSLDGPKEVHDHNRRYNISNHEQVVRWIPVIKDYINKNNLRMGVNALLTISKNSLPYYKKIIDEYVRLDLEKIHIRFIDKLGLSKDSSLSYSKEEFVKFWKRCIEYIEKLNKDEKIIEERMVKIIQNRLENNTDYSFLDLRSPCGAGIGQLAYNYNGDIYTCDEARMINDELFLIGNVKKDFFKDVLTSQKTCMIINSSLNDQFICDNCAYKPYCGICPVCNYAETGNMMANISKTDRCYIYMNMFDWIVEKKLI